MPAESDMAYHWMTFDSAFCDTSVRGDHHMPTDAETTLITAYHHDDVLRRDLDQLAVQIEKLLCERARIIAVLSTFYRSEVTTSSALNPLLDLARDLDPTLDERPVRS